MARPTPDQLLSEALRTFRAGRIHEAIDAYQRLLSLRPDLPDSWYNLAYLQHRARQYELALASYQRALDHGVRQPEEAHLNRAVILADCLGRMDEAEQEFRTALSLNPRYLPALINLGNLYEQCGDRERALAAYEGALEIEPGNALALSRLPNLTPIAEATDPLIAHLRTALSRSGVSHGERADLGFALGKALDAAGVYDEAFAAYCEANRDSKLSAGPHAAQYDRAGHERFIDRLMRAFAKPAGDETLAGGSRMIFICGMFRSGSTLVEQILASHPRITAGGELDYLPTIARQHLRPAGDSFVPIEASTLKQLQKTYLDGVASLHPGADLVTDKRPDNFLYIGLIKTLFPDAKIVHTRRNPLDNCLSVFFLHLDHSMSYALDLLDIAHWYRQYERLMTHWKSLYGDLIHDVDYDHLVADPRKTVKSLLEYCEVPWEDACLAFHKTKTVIKTPSAWQVRRPLYSNASGRWRNYEPHLHELRAALAGTLT